MHKEKDVDKKSLLKNTIERLLSLIDGPGKESAEELRSTWSRSKGENPREHGPRLADLKRALDDGKTLDTGDGRGVPMRLVVSWKCSDQAQQVVKPRLDRMQYSLFCRSHAQTKTCKASWHYDGTWPLLASDETSTCSTSTDVDIPRSVHTSEVILRPPGQHCVRLPPPDAEPGPPQRPDPSPEQIALAYRDRGIPVPQLTVPASDLW